MQNNRNICGLVSAKYCVGPAAQRPTTVNNKYNL